jgi:nucleoside-diphosphate-sugar epimerase
MSMNILVTGGAGYIGSILVPQLLAAGHKVTVLDNFMYRQNSLASSCFDDNFHVVKGDIRLESTLRPLIAAADVIIPLAALVGAPICAQDPVGAKSINRDAVLMMLKLMSTEQRILMPTTNSAYGTGDANNYCTEESPLRPISDYAIAKVEVEKALMAHPNAVSFRLATVFGMSPRMRTDLLVNDFTYRAVHDGFVVLFEPHFKRNYIHVRDVARVFMHAMDYFADFRGQIFNVGLSEANLSKAELCHRIQQILPRFSFIASEIGKDPDQRNYIVSNEKIEKTGFLPQVSVDAGIRELVKGYAMIKNVRYGNN